MVPALCIGLVVLFFVFLEIHHRRRTKLTQAGRSSTSEEPATPVWERPEYQEGIKQKKPLQKEREKELMAQQERGEILILEADYSAPPEADDLTRIGGQPVGIRPEDWPTTKNEFVAGSPPEPMTFALSLDVRDRDTDLPADVAAVALFFSGSDPHTEVMTVHHIKQADLDHGVSPVPETPKPPRVLPAGKLRLKKAEGLSYDDLYRSCFAGPTPVWMQGPDRDDAGFILQFDGDLFRSDEGSDMVFVDAVIYVFEDQAILQAF